MITESILNFFATISNWLVDKIPQMPLLTISDSVRDHVFETLNLINYIFPLNAVFICLKVIFAYYVTKITIAIIIRVKSFIPSMGD